MADIHRLRALRKTRPFPIPAGVSQIMGVLFGRDLNAADAIGRATFRLRRRKEGVGIHFLIPTGQNTSFSWNVTAMLGLRHASFSEARKWVAAYAEQHGQVVAEMVKPRMKQPTGDDRKLLRAGGCREAWLSSDTPALWAEAAVRCKHSGAFCGQDGYCHMGNCDMEMLPVAPNEDEVA